MTSSDDWRNLENPPTFTSNALVQTPFTNYIELVENVFEISKSLAHCFSADFKKSTVIAEKIREVDQLFIQAT